MHIIQGSSHFKEHSVHNPVMTLGNFDGVHLGHQKILKKVLQRAQSVGGASVVYTFHPHPLTVIRPGQEPLKITTFEEKAALIEQAGIDYLICERFNRRFSEKSPEDFIHKTICGNIHPLEIVIGHDFSFGRHRAGTIELLKKMGQSCAFQVDAVSDITIKNIPVRSTTIRTLIASGRVSLAAKLLGRHYAISGTVVHGKQRRIGFPTANLKPDKKLIPPNGVYVIRAQTPNGLFDGVVSIGSNPTFTDSAVLCVEAHLFDFNYDLYGKNMTLCFIKKIRGEKKFKEVSALTEQIHKDIAFAKNILAKSEPTPAYGAPQGQ